MIREILGEFGCGDALQREAEGLANSPSIANQAMAVGLVGNFWQPTTLEESFRVLMSGKSPADQARNWAAELSSAEIEEIEMEQGRLYSAVRELVLIGEERSLNEDERAREVAMRRRLQAILFVLKARRELTGNPLDQTIFLPTEEEARASTAAA